MQILKISALALLTTFLYACASGSAIVTGTVRAPIKETQVKLYLDAPAKYETIGLVKASSDSGWTEQGSQDYAVSELKKQAAKLGANGVLLITSGEMSSAIIGTNSSGGAYAIPITAQALTGKAIYVSE